VPNGRTKRIEESAIAGVLYLLCSKLLNLVKIFWTCSKISRKVGMKCFEMGKCLYLIVQGWVMVFHPEHQLLCCSWYFIPNKRKIDGNTYFDILLLEIEENTYFIEGNTYSDNIYNRRFFIEYRRKYIPSITFYFI